MAGGKGLAKKLYGEFPTAMTERATAMQQIRAVDILPESAKITNTAARTAAETKVGASMQNVQVGGTIKVAAEEGSRVVSATPEPANLNIGGNVAFAH